MTLAQLANSPDYGYMRSLQLFNDEQILKIKKSREGFEYKISQSTRTIKDYVEYIKYERKLMGTIKERLKQNDISTEHAILPVIADRMKQIYSQALSKFTQNVRFWDEYIKFLQSFKYTKDISSTFDRMLQFHSDNPEVWVRTILWEYDENFNDERVKSLLLRAKQRHPESQKLYLTFFRIELENKRKSIEFEALQHADVVYSSSKKKFKNIEFYIEMLNIVDKFGYAYTIQNRILNDMRKMFPRSEILWHTLAQRELKGLSNVECNIDFSGLIKVERESESMNDSDSENKGSECTDNRSEDVKMDLDLKQMKIEELATPQQYTLKKRIEICVQIYESAIEVIRTPKMWNYYINAMIDLNSDLSTQSLLKQTSLKRAFEGASRSNYMTEDYYIQYVELLFRMNQDDQKIEWVLHKVTKLYERSLRIWLLCMRYHIQNSSFQKVREIFKTAKYLLGTNGVKIWELYIMYVKASRSSEVNLEFNHFAVEISRQRNPAFNQLKASILEMLAATNSMKRVRKTYELFIKHYPVCYEVHDMMANLESKLLTRDLDAERKCLEMLVQHFGQVRTDVWLRYMQFERYSGEPKNIKNIYITAMNTLNEELKEDFTALYNFFSSGVV